MRPALALVALVLPLAGCADLLAPAPAPALDACAVGDPLAAPPAPVAAPTLPAVALPVKPAFARDAHGIPRIEAATAAEAWHAVGYAQAEDRLWQLETHRRAGQGRLAEILGPPWLPVDRLVRLLGPDAGARAAMLAALEPDTQANLAAYVAGVNARLDEVRADPAQLPLEFAALGIVPERWTADDVAGFASAFFLLAGFDAGSERDLVPLWLRLEETVGPRAALYFDDVAPLGRGAPTTVPPEVAFPERALPGPLPAQAAAARAAAFALAAAATSPDELVADGALDAAARELLPRFGSNMVLVTPERSASGGALLLGGPQVGYRAPALFWEAEVVVDGVPARWFLVPAAQVGVGRMGAFAFSATVGYADQVDLVLLELDGAGYRWGGATRAFEERVERFAVLDRPGVVGGVLGLDPARLAQAATVPPMVEVRLRFSEAGPVVAVDEAAGWAVAARKAGRGEELRILDFFLDGDLPAWSADAATARPAVERALASFPHSFNIFVAYADGGVSYRQTGRSPLRADGWDPRLPLVGGPDTAWSGVRTWACMPRADDPARGWLVNWNNVPQRGWPNMGAAAWAWGPSHRVQTLEDEVAAAVAEGPVDLARLNEAMRRAATRDAFAPRVAPDLLRMAGGDAATAAVGAWIAEGAPIMDADGDGNVDHAGVLVWETWRPLLERAIAGDELGDLVRTFRWGEDLSGNADAHGGGGESLLAALLAGTARADWWDDVRTPERERAEDVVRGTLRDLHAVLPAGGPDAWKRPMARNVFAEQGAAPGAAIPQVNRGSINFLVDFGTGETWAVLPPGQSGDARLTGPSPHALDQVAMYEAFEYRRS